MIFSASIRETFFSNPAFKGKTFWVWIFSLWLLILRRPVDTSTLVKTGNIEIIRYTCSQYLEYIAAEWRAVLNITKLTFAILKANLHISNVSALFKMPNIN